MAQTDLQLGMQYYKDGEYAKAIEYLEPVAFQYLNDQTYKALLNCYLSLEEYGKARKLNKNFIKKSRLNQMDLLADKIYINILDKNERGADKAVDEIKNRIKANPSLAFSAGASLQKRGYPKIALEIFEMAEAANPAMNFDYQKAQLYGELGEIKRMYDMYVSMVIRSPNYISTVKTLIGQGIKGFEDENTDYLKEMLIKKIQDGAPGTINELLIYVYIQEKNFRGAFTQLKAIDRRNGGNRAQIFNLGRIALNSAEYRLSQKIFDYVLKAGKDNPYYEDALVSRLEARRKALESNGQAQKYTWKDLQGEYEEVMAELKGMPEIGPLSIDMAHFTAFRLNNSDSAIAILKNVLNIGFVSPESKALAKIELGDILLYNGERWEAILYYGQAEKAFEKSPIGQKAKFNRAKAAYYVGDFKWAQGIFDVLKESTSKLIANDAMKYSLLINDNIALDTTTDAMEVYAHADLLNFQDKYDSALFYLELIQLNYPGHSLQDEVLLLKANLYIAKKEYQKAAGELQTLITDHKEDILADDALYTLAGLYEVQLDRKEEAKELYRTLFTDHPDSFFTAEARKKYRQLRGDTVEGVIE